MIETKGGFLAGRDSKLMQVGVMGQGQVGWGRNGVSKGRDCRLSKKSNTLPLTCNVAVNLISAAGFEATQVYSPE